MIAKFKYGQKVVWKNKLAKISEIFDDGSVMISDKEGNFIPTMLKELSIWEEPEFKVGDRVCYKDKFIGLRCREMSNDKVENRVYYKSKDCFYGSVCEVQFKLDGYNILKVNFDKYGIQAHRSIYFFDKKTNFFNMSIFKRLFVEKNF